MLAGNHIGDLALLAILFLRYPMPLNNCVMLFQHFVQPTYPPDVLVAHCNALKVQNSLCLTVLLKLANPRGNLQTGQITYGMDEQGRKSR